jgi:hypothetical protein
MDVIPMRVKKEVAYVFPGAFFSGPWPEKLNRKTVRLRPATRGLQSLIEPPPEILPSFVFQDLPTFNRITGPSKFSLDHIPLSFPDIESDTANGINIDGTANFVMTEDSGFKEQSNSVSAVTR